MAWSAYWCPKADTPRADWEDGCAYSPSSGWFAVADGASSGVRSREWAFHLSNEFLRAGASGGFDDGEGAERFVQWTEHAGSSFDADAAQFNEFVLPEWIRVASSERGAFATFLGGHVSACRWRAFAVGDCCLFHVRDRGRHVEPFPLQPGHDASAAPMLLTSVTARGSGMVDHVRCGAGTFEPGDCLLVATDALAHWMLGELTHRSTWTALTRIGEAGFQRACRDLRAAELLKNDDVTMLRISNVEVA